MLLASISVKAYELGSSNQPSGQLELIFEQSELNGTTIKIEKAANQAR